MLSLRSMLVASSCLSRVPRSAAIREEPQKSLACVACGIFVDSTNGDDGEPGTRAAPLKTLGAALLKLK